MTGSNIRSAPPYRGVSTLKLRVRRDASGGLDIDVATDESAAPMPDLDRAGGGKAAAVQTPSPAGPSKRRRSLARQPRRPLILFLAATPEGSDRLDLAAECAAIERELRRTPGRDELRFESRWAVGIDDVMRHVTELDPTVIHFSGHGGVTGLLLQDAQGRAQPVSARGLALMIAATARQTRLVVLNACWSQAQAEALCIQIDCVIGMDGALGELAARVFAVRLYGALGNRRSMGNAFSQAVAALAAMQLPEELMPCCLTRAGVDPDEIVLARNTRRPRRAGRPRK
jgi:hypothetical protein